MVGMNNGRVQELEYREKVLIKERDELKQMLKELLFAFGSRVFYNPEPSKKATISTLRLDEIGKFIK